MQQVICTTCDPPAVKEVPDDWEIADPYVCTVCQQRALKRLLRATDPLFGRMAHGDSIENTNEHRTN